jgi:arabinogalactan oligomer/maltooligosaccharide transport system substrate-binding protein
LCERGAADEPLALQVGAGDCFHVYPLFTSAGGRLLHEPPKQGWDADAMLAAESRAAFARLGALGEQGQRILRREIHRERAIALFTQGRTPYLVCAGWAVGDARAAGLRIGLSPMPAFADGGPPRSMVAVHGFCLANASANKSIAQDLIADYLTRTEVALALYAAQPRTPALRAGRDSVAAADEPMATFHELCERGDLIPSTEDSVAMFSIFHEAECAVLAGESTDTVLRRMSRSLARARSGADTATYSDTRSVP